MLFIYNQQPDLSSQNVCSQASLTTPSNQLRIIGLNLEIQHLFHLFTLLNFSSLSIAWNLLQLFQEAQLFSMLK